MVRDEDPAQVEAPAPVGLIIDPSVLAADHLIGQYHSMRDDPTYGQIVRALKK